MHVKLNKYVVMLIILGLFLGVLVLGLEVKKLRAEVISLSAVPSRAASFTQPYTRHEFLGSVPFEEETSPLEDLALMQRHMDQMLSNNFIADIWHTGIASGNMGKLYSDIKDYKDKYIISMDIPGMEKENINIEVKNGVLLVSGERNSEQEEKKADFRRKERSHRYFSEGLTLPEDANVSGIAVTYDKGVLKIEIPKLAKADANNDKPIKIKVN